MVSGNYFTGSLDGQGHTISNLYINSPNAGLIAYEDGRVNNLGLANVDMTGDTTGAITAINFGSLISHVFATGSITGTVAGGLVGLNLNGTIAESYSAASVMGSASQSAVSTAGGLVGVNSGNVTRSYSTGNVS